MNVFGLNLDSLAIWAYSFVGTLFAFYAFIIFLQRRVNNKARLTLSSLFFVIGLFFFNSAGKIMTGFNQFTILAVINSILLAAIGLILVMVVHKENRKHLGEDKHNKE